MSDLKVILLTLTQIESGRKERSFAIIQVKAGVEGTSVLLLRGAYLSQALVCRCPTRSDGYA